MKKCTICKIEKELNQFYKQKRMKDNYRNDCKKCCNNRSAKWSSENKEYRLDYDKTRYHTKLKGTKKLKDKSQTCLAKKYGLTLSEYKQLLDKQNNKCTVCGEDNGNRNLVIDHNHITNKLRGLLCGRCNFGLGYFQVDKYDIKLLKKAIKYMEDVKNGKNNIKN